MALFTGTTMVLEQGQAYARYFAQSWDLLAAVWGLLFVLICLVPALLIDLFFLPVRIQSRVYRTHMAASLPSNSGAEH